ncbi:CxxxxCH/CxxCH domain-containing protein, partial [Geobacter pelophilus]
GCHGNNAGSSLAIASGKHGAHINNPLIGSNYNCSECHALTITSDERTFANAALHGNSYYDYSGNRAGSSTSYDRVTGSCSATYCHSDGKGRRNAPFTLATGWKSGATLGCNGCHGNDATLGHFSSVAGEPNYQNEGIGSIRANSHRKHSDAGPGTCVSCHSDVTLTGFSILSGSLKHTNRQIDIKKGGIADFVWNQTDKSCSGIACHFNKNATWGQTLDCNSCHGVDVATLTTNKHTAHLSTTFNMSLGTARSCPDCHAKTVSSNSTISGPVFHANGFADYSGTKAGQYSNATGACANVYCHSDGKGRYNVPFDASNGWRSAFTIPDCKGCHGNDSDPAFSSSAGEPNYSNEGAGLIRSNSHFTHTTKLALKSAAACDYCHTDTVTSDGLAAKSGGLHLSGGINVVFNQAKAGSGNYDYQNRTCNNTSCHSGSVPKWGDAGSVGCNTCHGGDALTLSSKKHSAHISTTANPSLGTEIGCFECHAKTVDRNRGIVDQAVHINSVLGDYSGLRAGTYSFASGVCSNSYCHSDGKGRQNVPFTEGNGWNSAAAYPDCTGCHGNDATLGHFSSVAGEPNYFNGGRGVSRANSHQKHVGGAGAATCVVCHSETVTVAGNGISAGSVKHINSTLDVKQGGTASFGWTGDSRTCSTINCHFNKDAVWGDTLDCNGCHASDSSSLTTGKHGAHLSTVSNPSLGTAIGCFECHAKTMNSDNLTISNPEVHINGVMGDYSGTRAGQYSAITGSCANSYCHSDGKGKQNVPFDPTNGWKSAAVYADCAGCHGNDVTPAFTSNAGEPNYANEGAGLFRANSHRSHTTKLPFKNAAACDYCHTDTVTTDGLATKTGSLHLSGGINVVFNQSKSGNGSYDYQNRTCTNTSCHSGAEPKWGDASSAGCILCHGNLTSKPGFHSIHIGNLISDGLVTFYAYTANRSDLTTYRIGCANCHPSVEEGNHRNGRIDLSLNRDKLGAGFLNRLNLATADGLNITGSGIEGTTGASISCKLAYCHSNGRSQTLAPTDFRATPNWYAGTRTANRCGVCHDNPPQYAGQSHYVAQSNQGNNGRRQPTEAGHMIGFHFANTYIGNNANGFLGFSSNGNKAHGNALMASTFSCNLCHDGVVSSTQIDTHAMAGKSSIFKCANCHSDSTPTRLQPGLIVDARRHINGYKDVGFPSVAIMSKAQLANPTVAAGWERFGAYKAAGSYDYMNLGNSSWDPVTKSCATACHFNRPVTWGSNQVECASCHYDD